MLPVFDSLKGFFLGFGSFPTWYDQVSPIEEHMCPLLFNRSPCLKQRLSSSHRFIQKLACFGGWQKWLLKKQLANSPWCPSSSAVLSWKRVMISWWRWRPNRLAHKSFKSRSRSFSCCWLRFIPNVYVDHQVASSNVINMCRSMRLALSHFKQHLEHTAEFNHRQKHGTWSIWVNHVGVYATCRCEYTCAH